MRMYFRQRLFSWLDSYDIYNEAGETLYTVEGKLAWGHCLHILDSTGEHIATVQERVLTMLPRFELYIGERRIDCGGWQVEGDFMEWEYRVTEPCGALVATISKEVLHLTDTYVIDVVQPSDALQVLMLVLAIDAEKCSRG